MNGLPSPCRRLAFAFLAVLALATTARAQQQRPPGAPAPAPPDATPAVAPTPVPAATPALPPPVVRFYTTRAVLWLGRTTVLPFNLSHSVAADTTFPASSTQFGLLEIVHPPTVLAEQTVGFVRVRGLLPGNTRLVLGNGVGLDLEIRPDPAGAADALVNPESGRPRIISPSADAVVWGKFAVGVETFDRFARPAGADGSPAANGTRVQLRLPDGRLLDPTSQTGPEVGPERHCQFSVQATDLPPGPARLVAVASPAAFTDLDRRANRPGMVMESDPLTVDARPVPPPELWNGECEDPAIMGNSKELLAPAHLVVQGFSNSRIPATKPDAEASGGKTVAVTSGEESWSLPFNVQHPGMYQLVVVARGDFASGAFPSVNLLLGSTEKAAGATRVSGKTYERTPVGVPVRMEGGPRMFAVSYRNDFQYAGEDRNLYLDRWELARVGELPPEPVKNEKNERGSKSRPDPTPSAVASGNPANGLLPRPPDYPLLTPLAPSADVLYPASGASVYGVDAAVARLASGAPRPAWVDLVVDGQPQGVRAQGPALLDNEPMVFPLLARGLTPGAHRFTIRVADNNGQTADSPAREFRVLPQAPAIPGQYVRAVFLLDRVAFGPEPRELAAVLTQGEAAWLNGRLTTSFDAPAEQAILRAACKQYPRVLDERLTIQRALYQWLASDNPVRTRFSAWTENHFSTWINKTEPEWKWHEHLDFCRLGIAPFADLLSASAHSPAMLKYLDQEKSMARKLNENYAREIMELHTLGVHGGYKQADVTALAGVLNGWTTTREVTMPQEEDGVLGLVSDGGGNRGGLESTFHFNPLMNDGKERDVFGLHFPATKDSAERHDHIRFAMEMLAGHPATAEHVCRKLAEHYVAVPAPNELVRAMAVSFLANGGDMRAVMRTMAAQPEFWRAEPRLATPFDFGMRVTRLCLSTLPPAEAPKALDGRTGALEGFLKKSGMGLFDRVTPDGYPEDGANYADSNALLQRWRFMQTLNEPLNRLVPPYWRTPLPDPAAGSVTRAANESASAPLTPAAGQRFIDLAAARLTGHLLAPDSNQSALEVLGDGTTEQMHSALVFIALLPETSLR